MLTPQEVLNALSVRTGIRLTFNELGLCRLRFDGRFIVDMETSDDGAAVFLYSDLGPLPAGEYGKILLKDMMRAHCLRRETGNTVFGLEHDNILAFKYVSLAEAGEDILYNELEDFLDTLEAWSDKITS